MNSESSTFKTSKKSFNKEISIPSSKSYANRLLILAALNPNEIKVTNLPLSSDVETMLSCFEQIGIDLECVGNDVIIRSQFPQCERDGDEIIVLDTGDGGTTNRFLLPFLALGRRGYELKASGHMRLRPMEPLVTAIRSCGVDIDFNPSDDLNEKWIVVKGPYQSKTSLIEIDCSQTTQFLTGLSLALSRSKISVKEKNLSVSLPYWHLTQNLIETSRTDTRVYHNPVDFSSLSYPLALAAVDGEVLITNCHEPDPNQADSQFLEILRDMGSQLEFQERGLFCKKKPLKGISFDGSQCPDVIPTLIFVCSFAEGESHLKNLEVLTHKECDRFTEMVRMLKAAKVDFDADFKNYELIIHGKGLPTEGRQFNFDPVDDHRMVMVTYLFQRILGGGTITRNAHHVKKSFANFFETLA